MSARTLIEHVANVALGLVFVTFLIIRHGPRRAGIIIDATEDSP